MPILCGTDFSPGAVEAGKAAASLAAKRATPLHLVYVNEFLDPAKTAGKPGDEIVAGLKENLAGQAKALRALGANVIEEFVTGHPDEILLARAKALGASVLVVSSVGRRGAAKWLLGSIAEQVVRKSAIPVLVVRQAAPIVEWTNGKRPLRVLVGAEFAATSDTAAAWAASLRAMGPVDLALGHVYWPPRERNRLGRPQPLEPGGRDQELEKALSKELTDRFGKTLAPGGKDGVRYLLRPGFGRPADHLLEIARAEKSDLVVVGSHQRRGLDRLFYGSVSYGVVQLSPVSVACVPDAEPPADPAIPEIRCALAATDLSKAGARVVAHACSLLPGGGLVHLVHALESKGTPNPLYAHYSPGKALSAEESAERRRTIETALRKLVPAEAAGRGIEFRFDVLEGEDVADTILEAANRFDADAICVASHGRSGVAKALLGSVAETCVKRSQKPVFVARSPSA